jgi:hypothetical protein
MVSKGHVLVTGATGLVGRDMMEHYAAQGYQVTAISRRKPHITPSGATWLSLDLFDTSACAKALGSLEDVIQIVFAALYEEPDLVKGWQAKEHGEKNTLMLRNTVETVLAGERERGKQVLKNVLILQGPKAYGVHVHAVRPGAREGRDEDRSIPVSQSSTFLLFLPHRKLTHLSYRIELLLDPRGLPHLPPIHPKNMVLHNPPPSPSNWPLHLRRHEPRRNTRHLCLRPPRTR